MSESATLDARPTPPKLEAQQGFLDALVAADRKSRSWREKLEALEHLLAEVCAQPREQQHPESKLGALVDLAVYARFLATGEISCVEDGRHFRPVHHARIAQQIHQHLSKFSSPELGYVARKIYPCLPSTAQAFQSAEPLTRIRDIAHRNDIPPELKREIKETLQNKLHRCAGPEDLVTSKRLLERIIAPGATYSGEFVEQFRIFHRELEQFFNAESLEQHLEALARRSTPEQGRQIQEFIGLKAAGSLPHEILRSLTDIRHVLQHTQAKQPDERQEYVLADISLEMFAFALLSDIGNRIDSAGLKAQADWEFALGALLLAVINAGLSAVSSEECKAIGKELRSWSKDFDPTSRLHCLRLKGTIDRAQRLAEAFVDTVMELFAKESERVGRALEVAEHSIRVFSEAEIRRDVVFQVSKLASILGRALRQQLGSSVWDVIVSGQASGRLLFAESLEALAADPTDPTIAVVERVDGDEDIGVGITAVITGHAVPHLSHLGVRARQAGVVFVTYEQNDPVERLRQLAGQTIQLRASGDGVSWEIAETTNSGQPNTERAASGSGKADIVSTRSKLPSIDYSSADVVTLAEVTVATGGAKAYGARRLHELAAQNAGFKTPPGLVLPFGTMTAALNAAREQKRNYIENLNRLGTATAEDFETRVRQLAEVIKRLPVPNVVRRRVSEVFGDGTRLMVRSSSNCEDLDASAGAGLYESVPNVTVEEVPTAVRTVWASLWTLRAAQDRRQSGIPHQGAAMAVLIQPMLDSEYSFVLHTTNPINSNARELYMEVAVGLGETLVSAGSRGTPYRLVWNKGSGRVDVLAFANFSQALCTGAAGGVTAEVIDYSTCELSRTPGALEALAKRLGQAAVAVEAAFGKAMDIEGAVVGHEVYFVQARPQQGLGRQAQANRGVRATPPRAPAQRRPKEPGKSAEITTTPLPQAAAAKVEAPNRNGMPTGASLRPTTLGLFEKRVEGDNSIMELARLRFQQAGLGAEVHAGTPEQLEAVLRFQPESTVQPVVHLPREFNLTDKDVRAMIQELAAEFADRVYGLLLHDRDEWQYETDAFLQAARDMESRLRKLGRSPLLFVEYAAGMAPERFAGLFEKIQDLQCITAAIDVGHVGIRAIRAAYSQMDPDRDPCALKDKPQELPDLLPELERAVAKALPAVLELISAVGRLGKPVHFHLHDGHPLSTFSPFGVSDHLSFFQEIPLDFAYHGCRALPPMYGPSGLTKIIAQALDSVAAGRSSFTLEIHPTSERRALGDAEKLFKHWRDKTNAEIMNHWLWVLAENHRLLQAAIQPHRSGQ